MESLITDSRKGVASEGSVFFAIKGKHHDGHHFLFQLYQGGVRQFVVEYAPKGIEDLGDANLFLVNSSLLALQEIAISHRSSIEVPVIGITGSNGKTIVKEWLYMLLSPDYKIAKNPGSYNSQLGVPLSVWQLQAHHQLGIFEAGVSKAGEMSQLARIIRPSIGVFTNLGSAHDEGFANSGEKLLEKLTLFEKSSAIIYSSDDLRIAGGIKKLNLKGFSWGSSADADIKIKIEGRSIFIDHKDLRFNLTLPFNDHASVENTMHCIAVMLYLGYGEQKISQGVRLLRSVPMRLELKEGINQCQIIDDTYNNDLGGLQVSLEFLSSQHQKKNKGLILSDILESGLSDETVAMKISSLITQHKINRFVGIGKTLSSQKRFFPHNSFFYETTESFLEKFSGNEFQEEIILIKGARSFHFEKIANKLQRKVHGTIMEIDLGAVVENLNIFKSKLDQTTKVMAMVKAFAYGSGSIEIANVLQFHKVEYLGVAYADEGVELRRNNISLPIMVMNPSEETFEMLLAHNLEPEIYSLKILNKYLKFLDKKNAVIHIKLDTGMHRLGFEKKEMGQLIRMLEENPQVRVASIFSHLAGADESTHDEFSKRQATVFENMANEISHRIGYQPIRHLLNSSGILRLSSFQYDMVRLGIGLYGVNPTNQFSDLKPVVTLKTIISQIKHIQAGDTIGYGRKGKAENDLTLATIAIGYADGFNRAFSRGVGEVLVHGKLAKVVGNVCMDMTMIDITGIPAEEGDDVIIFGKDHPLQALAQKINTIPYEILTNTSERVKRVFVAESI